MPMSRPGFDQRVKGLPKLGLGVSTEYGAASAQGALDVTRLRAEHPQYANFLEVGVETVKGLDEAAIAWAASGLPTTYHFLDINLDDPFGTRHVDLVVNAMPAYFYLMPRAAYAVFDGLLKYENPVTYEAMFEDVDESQLVLVVGESDNVFEPDPID